MDSTTWDKKYKDSELLWSADANIWVKDLTQDQPAGTALDIAAGEGRNALWLVARGWQVTAVDFSEVALQRARKLADEYFGPDAGRLTTLEADVETWVPQARSFDLVLVAYLHLLRVATPLRHASGSRGRRSGRDASGRWARPGEPDVRRWGPAGPGRVVPSG